MLADAAVEGDNAGGVRRRRLNDLQQLVDREATALAGRADIRRQLRRVGLEDAEQRVGWKAGLCLVARQRDRLAEGGPGVLALLEQGQLFLARGLCKLGCRPAFQLPPDLRLDVVERTRRRRLVLDDT